MSRLEELLAVSRTRTLSESEANAVLRLSRPVAPCRTPEGRKARYERCKDAVNARKRERWANDPEWRETKRARDRAWRERRKG